MSDLAERMAVLDVERILLWDEAIATLREQEEKIEKLQIALDDECLKWAQKVDAYDKALEEIIVEADFLNDESASKFLGDIARTERTRIKNL